MDEGTYGAGTGDTIAVCVRFRHGKPARNPSEVGVGTGSPRHRVGVTSRGGTVDGGAINCWALLLVVGVLMRIAISNAKRVGKILPRLSFLHSAILGDWKASLVATVRAIGCYDC